MKGLSFERKQAIYAGLSIVIMAVIAMFIMGIVFQPLFKMDKDHLAAIIAHNKIEFLLGTVGWLLILICDIIAAIALYNIYKVDNQKKTFWMAGARLVYSGILTFAIIKLITVFVLINGENVSSQQVYDTLQGFKNSWHFGLITFGFHLILLATLVCKKRSVLMFISVLLLFAGIGYVGSNTANLFIDNYEQFRSNVEAVFIIPMIFGELGLAIWLLIRGGNPARLKKKQFAYESC